MSKDKFQMPNDEVEILGVKVNNVTFNEALDRIEEMVEEGERRNPNYVVKPNAEIVTFAQDDPEFKEILNSASLAPPDGIGLMIASRILRKPLKERVGGPELMEAILKLAQERGYPVYFFGAKPLVVEKLVEVIKRDYSKVKVAGFHHGYFETESELEITEKIKKAEPDILFVALGFPKQEKWIKSHVRDINVPLMVAEGGSFDFLSGKVKRAPVWLQKVGLEWLFRLLSEPRRVKRQLALPYFVYLVLRDRFRKI